MQIIILTLSLKNDEPNSETSCTEIRLTTADTRE